MTLAAGWRRLHLWQWRGAGHDVTSRQPLSSAHRARAGKNSSDAVLVRVQRQRRRRGGGSRGAVVRRVLDVGGDAVVAAAEFQSLGACSLVPLFVAAAVMPPPTRTLVMRMLTDVGGNAAAAAAVLQSLKECSLVLFFVAAAVMPPPTWRLLQRMAAEVAAAVVQSSSTCSSVLVLAWPPTLGTMRSWQWPCSR